MLCGLLVHALGEVHQVANARRKLLDKAREKYRFKLQFNAAPDGLIVEDDRLVGLRFRRTRIEGKKVIPLDETFEARGRYVISSIGSIPAAMPGIPMKGELYAFEDWDLGRIAGYPTVFAAGNIVTGKGNIVASRKHATAVSEYVIERYLGLGDGHEGEEEITAGAREAAREAAEKVAGEVTAAEPLAEETLAALRARVKERQAVVGYDGDYDAWIARVTPPDLE